MLGALNPLNTYFTLGISDSSEYAESKAVCLLLTSKASRLEQAVGILLLDLEVIQLFSSAL